MTKEATKLQRLLSTRMGQVPCDILTGKALHLNYTEMKRSWLCNNIPENATNIEMIPISDGSKIFVYDYQGIRQYNWFNKKCFRRTVLYKLKLVYQVLFKM